jgi:hypothetical protein
MRPLSRPESITAAAVAAGVIAAIEPAAEAATTEPETAAAVNANLGGVSLNGLRPATRPEGVAPVVLPPWDGPALRLRPEGLAPEGAISVPEEAPAADPAEDLEGALSAIMAAAPDPVAGATAQAVPMALRPDARPNNFSRVVQNQQQILARSQQQAAPAAPAAAAEPQTGGVGTAGLSREEQAETAAEVSSGAIEPSAGGRAGGRRPRPRPIRSTCATSTFWACSAPRTTGMRWCGWPTAGWCGSGSATAWTAGRSWPSATMC